MPTIFSHAVVPLAIAVGLGSTVIPKRLLLAGIFACILPDFDVLAFRLGIPYAHDFGHRGVTHSLIFAIFFALTVLPFAKFLQAPRPTVFLFLLICTASHGMLDMLTNGGLGVAFFWPFSSERYFFPCQVVQVSPLSLHRFLSPAGLAVIKSELLWLWLPATSLAVLTFGLRKRMAAV